MNRRSFNKLVNFLQGLRKEDTILREAITLGKRVAIGLYALGSSAEYRSIANMFGVGKSTVGAILIDFCKEVWKCLHAAYMNKLPLTREYVIEWVKGFEAMGYPQCLGAIDGTDIEIHPHSMDANDYYNYKGWYSTVLMALVDARYRFTYISIGSPGRCNDSQIYEQSTLKKHLENCSLLEEMAKDIHGVSVPVHIIGDSAFRFSKKIMKPYPFCENQIPIEKAYNYRISKCRRIVENVFGQLKARFRRMGKGIDNKIENVPHIVKACCVLHNFLNDESDEINRQ